MRSLLFACCACCACSGPVAGFAPDEVDGAHLVVDADVSADHAVVSVDARDIGSVFGVSFHIVVDGAEVSVGDASTASVFGADAVTVARVVDHDVALGGARVSTDVGEFVVTDGAIATVEVSGRGVARVDVEGAVARHVDGSFVALSSNGGTLTFGDAP